jgi:hypothetical protein
LLSVYVNSAKSVCGFGLDALESDEAIYATWKLGEGFELSAVSEGYYPIGETFEKMRFFGPISASLSAGLSGDVNVEFTGDNAEYTGKLLSFSNVTGHSAAVELKEAELTDTFGDFDQWYMRGFGTFIEDSVLTLSFDKEDGNGSGSVIFETANAKLSLNTDWNSDSEAIALPANANEIYDESDILSYINTDGIEEATEKLDDMGYDIKTLVNGLMFLLTFR